MWASNSAPQVSTRLEDGPHPLAAAHLPDLVLAALPETRESAIREARLLRGPKPGGALLRGGGSEVRLHLDDVAQVAQEPGVDLRAPVDLLEAHTAPERLGDGPGTTRPRLIDLPPESRHPLLTLGHGRRLEARVTDLQGAQRLLKALLEGPTDGHHLAHRFHLGGEEVIGAGKFLEGEARHLGDHVVDAGLEAGRRLTGDVIGNLVEGESDGELGGDLRDRKAGRLRCQGRRPGDTRVHLDHHQRTVVGIDRELDVRPPGVDADLPDDGHRRIPHHLVFAVGERLGRSHGDRVAGVDAHGVEVLDRADDDDVVRPIAHHLELVLLPPEDAPLDQALVARRLLKRPLHQRFEFLLGEGDAPPGASEGEAGADDRRNPGLPDDLPSLFEGAHVARDRQGEADLPHRLPELVTVLGLHDRIELGADQRHAEAIEYAGLRELDGEVETRLAADRREQGVGPLGLDDLPDRVDRHRLDVGAIRGFRIGHDGRRVRVQEHHPVAFLPEGLAGLGSRVVELAGLSDHDRAGTDHENRVDVVPPGHQEPIETCAPLTSSPALRRATSSRKRRKKWRASWGPGEASGWY